MKEILIVSAGSFFGGGLRFIVSKLLQQYAAGMFHCTAFPIGTMAVNVLGCLLIGFLSGLPWTGHYMSPTVKLLLTTGFCGGFTTFSTYMNESVALARGSDYALMVCYVFGSLAVGFAAVLLGHWLAKCM